MNKLTCTLRRLLEEYSPLALLILILLCFLPASPQTQRRVLLLFCALPGIALTALNPKAVFKNPVHLLIMLFVAYFSAQDIRGSEEISFPLIRWQIVRAAIIILPAILLSHVTPRKKLYAPVIRLILLVCTGFVLFSIFSFYADNPFPLARLHLITGSCAQITDTAMICGFFVIIAGALFFQGSPRVTRWNWLELICLPILMAGMLYTHSRSSFLAFLTVLASSLFTLKTRLKKILCLYSIAIVTILLYWSTLQLAPAPHRSTPVVRQPDQPRVLQREEGVFATGKTGTFSINRRLDIWRCHLTRVRQEKKWLTGFGLGMNNFLRDVPPEKQHLYYIGEHGWEIHTHSGYVWALYFGGFIGLGILLLLQGAAIVRAWHAGEAGYLALTLVVFGAVIFLVDGKTLLAGGGSTYLLFWIPLGLAAGRVYDGSGSSSHDGLHQAPPPRF